MRHARGTSELSPLEQRLLSELANGVPSKMLAEQFGNCEASIHQHLKSLCRKLRLTGPDVTIKMGSLIGLD